MNLKENGQIEKIAKHVEILNHETGRLQKDVGKLKVDICWIKKLLWGIAGMMFLGVGKVIFFG